MARHDLREDLLGDERRAADVIDAELPVGAFPVRVVQAGDGMFDAEDAASDLDHHKIRVIVAGHSRNDIAILDAGAHEHTLVEAEALKRGSVEVASERGERIGLRVDDAHVAPVRRQHRCERRADAPASHDDDVGHWTSFPLHGRCALKAHLTGICSRRCERPSRRRSVPRAPSMFRARGPGRARTGRSRRCR